MKFLSLLHHYVVNIVSTTLASTALGLILFHDMTSFHVFVTLLFAIVAMYVLVDKRERKSSTGHSVHKLNVFYCALVWFYITYGVVGTNVHMTNFLLTNILSGAMASIAVFAAFYRKNEIYCAVQEKLIVAVFLILCFPINIILKTTPVMLLIRKLVFATVFNLELYVGELLDYGTTYKQLFLVSYFAFVVDSWYLLACIPVVLSHFTHIKRSMGGVLEKNATDEENQLFLSQDCEKNKMGLSKPKPKPNSNSILDIKKNNFADIQINL